MGNRMSWIKKNQDDKHTHSGWGKQSDGYSSERGKTYESDAKALAGKEKREMEKLFGKKSSSSKSSSTSKYSGGSSSFKKKASGASKFNDNGKLPTMFTQ